MKFVKMIKADIEPDFWYYLDRVENQMEVLRESKRINEVVDIIYPLTEELKKASQALSSILTSDNATQRQKTFKQLEKEGIDVEPIRQICTYVWGYGAYDNKFAKQYTPEKWLKYLERMLEHSTNTEHKTVGDDMVVTKYPKAIEKLKQWMDNL